MMEAFDQSSLEDSNLTGAINALLQDIQKNVVDVILAEHEGTQDDIDAAFSTADSAVKTASSTWTATANKWTTLSNCSEAERSLSAKYHREAADVELKKQIEETKKSAMEKAAEISASLPGMTFYCNAAVDGACSQKLEVFKQSVEAKMTLLEASVETQMQQYEVAKSEYEAARQNRLDAEVVRDRTNTAHYTRYVTCNGDEASAKDSFCDVAAVAETSACDEIARFQRVVAKTQGKDNPLSHSDRASEYDTVMRTMCLLRSVIDEFIVCSQTDDITDAPGFEALDLKEKEAESLVCHVKDKRTLSQFTWTRPERTEAGPPAEASSYEKVASQAMDLNEMKIEWCRGSTTTTTTPGLPELIPLSDATISSGSGAAFAIDGNEDADAKITHTNHGDKNPSWAASIAAGYSPTKVVIWNRVGRYFGKRTDGCQVFIDGVLRGTVGVAGDMITIPAGECGNVRTNPSSRIELKLPYKDDGISVLNVREVEVFGLSGR
jgi:hypothetical protein